MPHFCNCTGHQHRWNGERCPAIGRLDYRRKPDYGRAVLNTMAFGGSAALMIWMLYHVIKAANA